MTTPKIAAQRDAVAGVVGKVLSAFSLAQISLLQQDSNTREEMPMFDNDSDSAPKRPWQTFGNFTADKPDKAVTTPITFATDVKMGLASLFIGIADLVNSVGKLPAAEPLTPLLASHTREANIVRLMVAVTEQMHPHLCPDPMNCDLGYPAVLRQKLAALVDDKKYVDPGAEPLARLYFNFLKVIAWHSATIAYEHEHLTLNRSTLLAIVAQMSAAVPEAAMPTVRDVLSLIREQIGKWDRALAQAKAVKNKKAPAKTTAKTPAKTVTKPKLAPRESAKVAPSPSSAPPSALAPAPSPAPAPPPSPAPTPSEEREKRAVDEPVDESISEAVDGAQAHEASGELVGDADVDPDNTLELAYDELVEGASA